MPIYEYVCETCSSEVEEMQKFSDPPLSECPQCHELKLIRKVSKTSFHLKGNGWYKDHYGLKTESAESKAKTEKSKPQETATPVESSSSANSESKSTETTPPATSAKPAETKPSSAANTSNNVATNTSNSSATSST